MLLLFWIGCSNPLEECYAACDKLDAEVTYEELAVPAQKKRRRMR